MSNVKLVNASPEEIREYFKGTNVRWVDTFNENNVPDEIIIEFKDRIFRGDSYSRADAIINMMVKHNRKLSKELFDIIDNKFGCTRFYHINEVYDFVEYLSALSDYDLLRHGYTALITLETVPNVSLDFAKRVLELQMDQHQKHNTLDKMLSNVEHPILPEVYEYIVEKFKSNYHPYYLQAGSYAPGEIEPTLFTVEEYVSRVQPEYVVSFFDHGHRIFKNDGVLKSVFNTETVIQIVVDKLIDLIDSGKSRPLAKREWVNTKALIQNHPMFEKIELALTSQQELYSRKEISWDEADALITEGKMQSEILEIVLLRLDAPLWFTDKYQSKILQLIARRGSSSNSIPSFFYEMMAHENDHSCFGYRNV